MPVGKMATRFPEDAPVVAMTVRELPAAQPMQPEETAIIHGTGPADIRVTAGTEGGRTEVPAAAVAVTLEAVAAVMAAAADLFRGSAIARTPGG
jgi:hypothetical protein